MSRLLSSQGCRFCALALVVTSWSGAALAQGRGQRPHAAIPIVGPGKDLEGALWDYRAMRPGEATLTGKIRIKGQAIFEVGPLPRLPQRETRIGDVISEKGQPVQLVFLDEAPLHGQARVEYNKEKKIWVGRFDDQSGKRWKFELRKNET